MSLLNRPSLRRLVAIAGVGFSICSAARAELLPVTTSTGGALGVTCEQNLHFGDISLPPDNVPGSISVAASPTGDVSGTFPVVGHQQGLCTITDVAENETATVTVSGGGGSWNATTRQLTGATLKSVDDPQDVLDVTLELDRDDGITTDPAPEIGAPVYIGGTLEIPASVGQFGTYTETFTIHVTE